MSSPINNNPQPIPLYPTTSVSGTFTPLEKMLIDTFAPSIASIAPTPPVDASNPEITAAEFFSSVSAAQLKQKLQEFINSIADPLLRQKLLEEVGNRAASVAELINLIVQYRELLFRLNELDLPGKQKRLNDAVDSYNTNGGQDGTQVANMNAAIGNFQTAQNTYQAALTTYQTALSTFSSAQNVYNLALANWNTALSNYNNGSITQAQLETARSTFNNAQVTFDNAKTVMNAATSVFNVAKTNWANAQAAFTTATNTYNSYVSGREGDLGSAIDDYNSAVQQSAPIVGDMKSIQSFLFGTNNIQNPNTYSNGGLPVFDLGTPGPDTLRDQVQGTLDSSNLKTSAINTTIGQISTIINTINGGGYTPTLVAPGILTEITDLPTEQSNFDLDPIIYQPPTRDTFDYKALTEFNTDFLTTMLNAINEYNSTSDKEEIFQRQVTDLLATFVAAIPDQTTGVGSSVSVSANTAAVGGRSNPHLLGALSKHVIETILNVYGVPAGSPLVDQMGALVYGYRSVLGLLSIIPAQATLGDSTIPAGAEGKLAVNAAVSLGTLSGTVDLVSGNQIFEAVTNLVNSDPTLSALPPEQKNALIQALVQEIGVSLIKAALNQLAVSIDLPGLVSQILANISLQGDTKTDVQQLIKELILSQELAKQLNISSAAAQEIVQNAFQELLQKNQALTQDAVTQAIIDQIRADRVANAAVSANAAAEDAKQEQISEDAALEADIKNSVIKADAAASARIQEEVDRRDQAKRDAFLDSVRNSLEALYVDPVQIDKLLDIYKPTVLNALISGLIKPNFLEALTNHLIKLPLAPAEAREVVQTAITKANSKDATLNPLSTFIGNQVLGLNDQAAIFKAQVANIFTPALGPNRAADVAENSGGLIDSATRLWAESEKGLAGLAGYNFNTRTFENYRDTFQVFIDPARAQGNPLHEANVVLLSGQAAGLSLQGTTSADNKLGTVHYNPNPIGS